MGGVHPALDLPKVDFGLLPVELHDAPRIDNVHLVPFGYNDPDASPRYDAQPNDSRYKRWIQPLESELAKQVEYDMDEQDQVWLDQWNADRKKDGGHSPMPYELFEVVMDKIEKEWFDLTKSIPKKTNALPSENELCAICDDGECENSNAIVFCDGCNLAVHQDCYGVPYIPEGQWLCRKCTVSPDKPVHCVFCPISHGAFKQTTTGHWGHLLCAIWIPETGVSNTVYMEPVDGVELIPKSRWKLVCYLCKKRVGACIQCSNRNCYTAYHVTCAREYGLELKMKSGGHGGAGGGGGGELKSWCDKHGKVQADLFALSRAGAPAHHPPASSSASRSHHASPSPVHRPSPLQASSQLGVEGPAAGTTSSSSNPSAASSSSLLKLTLKLATAAPAKSPNPTPPSTTTPTTRSTLAYKRRVESAPPVVPQFVFERVMQYVSKVKGVTNKKDFIQAVCRYWSLKREARRGAPLLKRIHLEPWTASATSRLQSDSDRAHKLELLKLIRNDLEKVRMLTEQVRKREKKKLERLLWVKEFLDEFVWPREERLRKAWSQIVALDKQQYFLHPVDPVQVPDYYDVVSNPMDWTTIGTKLDRHEYETAAQFKSDVLLVMSNARHYNKPSAPVHRSAVRISESIEPILTYLDAVDDPGSAVGTIELVEPRILLERIEDDEVQGGGGGAGEAGRSGGGAATDARGPEEGTEPGQASRTVRRRGGPRPERAVDEIDSIWYDVEDPLGEKRRAEEAAERFKAEEDERERERVEAERVEREKAKEQEEARDRKKQVAEVEKRDKGKARQSSRTGNGKGKEQAAGDEVEMAPPSRVGPGEAPSVGSKKRTAGRAGLDGEGSTAEPQKPASRTTRSGAAVQPSSVATADGSSGHRPSKKARTDSRVEVEEVPSPASSNISPKIGDAARLVQDEISARETFKLFETGWVLPEGSSRRKPPTPLVPTAALPAAPAPPPAPSSKPKKAPRASAAPLPAKPETSSSTSLRKGKDPADGVGETSASNKASPAKERTDKAGTIASAATETKALQSGKESAATIREWQAAIARYADRVTVDDKTDLSDGTLVWHRTLGSRFPWYPAEVADPDGADMPPALLNARPKTGVPRVPVLYFDENRSGQWALRSELKLLGEVKHFDDLMQSPAAIKAVRKANTSRHKPIGEAVEDIVEAYEYAMSLAEADDAGETGAKKGNKGKGGAKRANKKRRR
ncbi:hypothetical protein JCM10212_005875 [Sporobolomyces blumeae]